MLFDYSFAKLFNCGLVCSPFVYLRMIFSLCLTCEEMNVSDGSVARFPKDYVGLTKVYVVCLVPCLWKYLFDHSILILVLLLVSLSSAFIGSL